MCQHDSVEYIDQQPDASISIILKQNQNKKREGRKEREKEGKRERRRERFQKESTEHRCRINQEWVQRIVNESGRRGQKGDT